MEGKKREKEGNEEGVKRRKGEGMEEGKKRRQIKILDLCSLIR